MSIEHFALQGFRYPDSEAAHWELSPAEPDYTSVGKLFTNFMEEWKWDHKPLAWVRNIENSEGAKYFDYDSIYIVYRRNYQVVIRRAFRDMFGPHACQVRYRPYQNSREVVWVAICQIRAMWHSDERILKAFQEAVDAGELYQSEDTAQLIVIE